MASSGTFWMQVRSMPISSAARRTSSKRLRITSRGSICPSRCSPKALSSIASAAYSRNLHCPIADTRWGRPLLSSAARASLCSDRSAAGMASAGQVVEAFVMQRSVLEYAGYALVICETPSLEPCSWAATPAQRR